MRFSAWDSEEDEIVVERRENSGIKTRGRPRPSNTFKAPSDGGYSSNDDGIEEKEIDEMLSENVRWSALLDVKQTAHKPDHMEAVVNVWEHHANAIVRDSWMHANKKAIDAMNARRQRILVRQQALKRQAEQRSAAEERKLAAMMDKIELQSRQEQQKVEKETAAKNATLQKGVDRAIALRKQEYEAMMRALREEEERTRKEAEEQARKAKEASDRQKAAREQKERERKDQEEAKARKEKMAQEVEAAKRLQKAKGQGSVGALQEAEMFQKKLEYINGTLKKAINANPEWKAAASKARMFMKPKMGQLTNSAQQIQKVTNEVHTFLEQSKANGQEVYAWTLNVLSKAIVHQAEAEVTVKLDTAFPIAHLIVMLMPAHPQFLEFLLTRMAKKCSYIIPRYHVKKTGQSDKEVRTLMGYKMADSDDESSWESEVQYTERMCGILALWSAMVQTNPPGGANEYGLNHGWTWFARILNMAPRAITPALINVFLEIAGQPMLSRYPNQMRKAMNILFTHVLPQCEKLTGAEAVSATSRLQIYLEDYKRRGILTQIEGSQPER